MTNPARSTVSALVVVAVAVATVLGTHRTAGTTSFVLVFMGFVAAMLLAAQTWSNSLRWRSIPLLVLACGVVLVSVVRVVDVAGADGTVFEPPVNGGSDQIDYVSMAYAFSEHGVIGTTAGSGVAEPVLEVASRKGLGGNQLERWKSIAEREDRPRSYAYRPILYPLSLGSFFIVRGYEPADFLVLNTLFYAAGALCLFLSGNRLRGPVVAVGAVGCYLASPILVRWTTQAMPESLTVALASAAILVSTLSDDRRVKSVALGLLFGLLALSKQVFFLVGVVILVALWIADRRTAGTANARKRSLLRLGAFLVIALPWMSYNVGVTGHVTMPLGTSGWHDMPSAYSAEYLTDRSRFVTREQIFDEYAARTGEPVSGDVARSQVGREIFFQEARTLGFWTRLPRLVQVKLTRSMTGPNYLWIVRLLALGGLFALVRSRTLLQTKIVITGLTLLPIGVVAATFSDAGRLILVSWPGVSILAALALHQLAVLARLHVRSWQPKKQVEVSTGPAEITSGRRSG